MDDACSPAPQPSCTVSIPIDRPSGKPVVFPSQWATDQYSALTSDKADSRLVVRHLCDPDGAVVGFVAYSIAPETLDDVEISANVESIYIMERFRGEGYAKMLVEPLAKDALNMATGYVLFDQMPRLRAVGATLGSE